MQYQSDGTQVNTRPAPSAVNGTPGWVTGGNPAAGIAASDDDPDVMNQILDELVGTVVGAGLTPSKTNSAQLLQAIRALITQGVPASFSSVYSFTSAGQASYFWRISPDGFVEQGGFVVGTGTGGAGVTAITYPIPFPSGQPPILNVTLVTATGSPSAPYITLYNSATEFGVWMNEPFSFNWSARWH